MKRTFAARVAVGIAVFLALAARPAGAQLVRVADTVVDANALIMPSNATYGRMINGAAFQENAVQTFGGYQYTSWYTNDATASVMIARRTVSGTQTGSWESVNTGSRFTNGKGSSDAHNVISFGIAGDGSIHLSWDMHGNTLRYRRTAAGIATSGSSWNASMFQAEQNFLVPGSSAVGVVTYPQFIPKPHGGMLFAARLGASGNGDNWLWDYDNGTWSNARMVTSRSGTFTDMYTPAGSPSTSRNAYWNGYDYGPDGVLYTTWTWRESNNAYANHDINFASSADGGFTWLNNAGSVIGDTTAARPMTVASPGQVIQPLDRQQSLINQQAQIVMGDGSVHAVMYHRRPDQPWAAGDPVYSLADSSYYDYVRDPSTGDWSRHEIPGLVGTRAALARSADDTLYAVYVSPGTPLSTINTANGASGQLLTIAAAHKASGWDDWAIVYRDNLRSFVNEPRVDAERLLTGGILSVYVQENTSVTSTTGTPLRVLDFIAAASPSGDGWTPTGGGSWTTAANWTPAVVPSSGTAQATIGYGFQGGSAITLDAAVTLNRLTYLGASGTIGPGAGGTLAFGGTSATVQVESAVAITAPVAGSFLKSGAGMLMLATDNSAGLAGKTLTIAGGQLMTSTGGTAAGTEFGSATTTVSVQPSGQIWLAGVTAGAKTFPQTIRISGSGEGAAAIGAIVNDSGVANAIALAGPIIVESDATIASLNNATYTFGTGSTGIAEATAGRRLTISLASGTSVVSGTIGVTTLVKAGNGTLRLGSANRLVDTGTVQVDGGTLHLGGASDRVATIALTGGAIASGTLTAELFDLQLGTFSAVLSGSGTIRKSGPGTATLSGSNSGFTGTTSITEGTLAITSTAALPGWNVPGRFAVSGSATLAVPAAFSDATIATLVTTGNFSSGGRIGLDTTGGTRVLSFGSGSQGDLGIFAIGSGTLVGSSSNSFAGGLTVGGGLARVTAAGGFGKGPITITGSAARLVLASNVTLGNDIIVDAPAGAIANGVIQYEGSGTGRLSGGTVTVLGSSTSGGTFASTGGGTLVVDDAIMAPAAVPVSMRIGTTVFGGGGNYRTFLINEGTARLGGDDGLSPAATVTIGASYGATLDLAGFDQSLDGILKGPGSATVGNSSTSRDAILTLTGSSTFAGSIQNAVGAGSRRVSLAVDGGWLRLTAANTFSGSTAITGGTLQVGHARALASSTAVVGAGGLLAVDAAVTLVSPGITVAGGVLSVPRLVIGGTAGIASVVVESGSISGTPAVSVLSNGVMRLPAGRQMTVSASSLTIVETAGGGLLDLGAGRLEIAAGGMTAAALLADLRAGFANGTWNGTTGLTSLAAATAAAGGLRRGVGWLEQSDGSWTVAYTSPGDSNLDGLIDVLDAANLITAARYNTGAPATWAEGDFNYDGIVDVLDSSGLLGTGLYDQGSVFLSGSAGVVEVPEPSASAVVAAALAAITGACCRHRRIQRVGS